MRPGVIKLTIGNLKAIPLNNLDAGEGMSILAWALWGMGMWEERNVRYQLSEGEGFQVLKSCGGKEGNRLDRRVNRDGACTIYLKRTLFVYSTVAAIV